MYVPRADENDFVHFAIVSTNNKCLLCFTFLVEPLDQQRRGKGGRIKERDFDMVSAYETLRTTNQQSFMPPFEIIVCCTLIDVVYTYGCIWTMCCVDGRQYYYYWRPVSQPGGLGMLLAVERWSKAS